MSNPSKQSIFNSSKILKATNVKKVHPIYQQLAESLSHIDILKFIKIYNGRLCASNLMSENKKKEPITKIGEVGVVGVELLINSSYNTIDFYSLTSSQKGYDRKIVESVVVGTPEDWALVITMDWSGGFWQKMLNDYPRIVVL